MVSNLALIAVDVSLVDFMCVCADNIWTDQNLLLDPDLPSGWRTIKDSTGTYYWHVPTGATQWQHPRLSGTPQLLDTQVRRCLLNLVSPN